MKKEKSENFGERLRDARFTLRFTQDEMAQLLDVSGNYIYLLESGTNKPGPKMLRRLEEVELELESKSKDGFFRPNLMRPVTSVKIDARNAPVVSWATAGQGGNFADLASQIDEFVTTDSRDANAYALIIEGDSMMPKFEPGDRVVFMPNVEPQNGDVVVARVEATGDVYFKVFHIVGQKNELVRLTSYNPVYPPLEFARKDFRFIHPMYEMRRRRRY